MKKIVSLIGVAAFALAAIICTGGCASAHDRSQTEHSITARGVALPPGWSAIVPDVTNTPTGNEFTEFSFIPPAGTNEPGFFTSLVNRPKVFDAYRETWTDKSAGGGIFVFTDPQASQLSITRVNQSALGGSHAAAVGNIQSTITTNAVSAIGAAGTAVGNVIGAAASAAAGK